MAGGFKSRHWRDAGFGFEFADSRFEPAKLMIEFPAIAFALLGRYTPRAAKRFRKTEGAGGFSPLNSRTGSRWASAPGNSPRSVRRRSVFLAAGGEEDGRDEDHDDDGNHKKRRSNVHGAGSLLLSD